MSDDYLKALRPAKENRCEIEQVCTRIFHSDDSIYLTETIYKPPIDVDSRHLGNVVKEYRNIACIGNPFKVLKDFLRARFEEIRCDH